MREALLPTEPARNTHSHATKVGVVLAVVFLFEVMLGIALVSRTGEPTPKALLTSASMMLAAETGRMAARAQTADTDHTYMSATVSSRESDRDENEKEKEKEERRKHLKPDAACVWTPHQLVNQIAKPRPPGPRATFHCEPREGPPLPTAARALIKEETLKVFVREFDVLFAQTSKLDTGGNPQFQCTSDCGDGQWTEHWGAAFASVDGHMHAVGYDGYVSLMSQSKIVAYMLALQLLGSAKVEEYVSAEPSGRSFGDYTTMKDHRAFNPYVSTGAEIIWALLDGAAVGQYRDTIELNRQAWARLSAGAGGTVRMRTGTIDHEDAAEAIQQLPEDPRELSKPLASSNLAALYVMAAKLVHLGGLPANSSIDGTYQGFVTVNNLRLTPQMMAMAAATLANGGINPVSGERVLSYRLVRYVLTTMMTAGLYDGSGRWAYTVGMPAKSGVAGGLLVVAPGVGGFATVSEPLDLQGNSARGLAFFSGLAHKFPFLHSFTPGAGSDPNLALTPVQGCHLTSMTVEQEPGEYAPE